MAVNIDWGLAQSSPDIVGNYLKGQQVGNQLAVQRAQLGMAQRQMQGQQQAAAAYANGDIPGAQAAMIGSGQIEGASAFGKLSDEQVARAHSASDDILTATQMLKGLPQEQRMSAAQQMLPALQARNPNIKPEMLQGIDLSDAGLENAQRQVLGIKGYIDLHKPQVIPGGATAIDPANPLNRFTAPQEVKAVPIAPGGHAAIIGGDPNAGQAQPGNAWAGGSPNAFAGASGAAPQGNAMAGAQSGAPAPQNALGGAGMQPGDVSASAPPPAPPGGPMASVSPQDRDALIRMAATEAANQGPEGIAAVTSVALNRARQGYGGASSLYQVVHAPNQFEGMKNASSVDPATYAKVAPIVDAVLQGQTPDPTGGAMQFLNPTLQTQLGRKIPAWAQGQGQRIGAHVFYGGQPSQNALASTAPANSNALNGGSGSDTLEGGSGPSVGGTQMVGGVPVRMLGGDGPAYRPATNAEKQALGIPEGVPAQAGPGGKITPVSIPAAQLTPSVDQALLNSGKTGPALLKALPGPQRNMVQMMITGRMAPPTSQALRTPQWQSLLQAASLADPSFDETTWVTRNTSAKDFASTRPGTAGGNIVSFNTALQHLGTLANDTAALHNMGGLGTGANALVNTLVKWTGGNEPTNYTADRQPVSSEIERTFRQAGGSEADIKALQAAMDPNAAPKQQWGALDRFATLLHGKLNSMQASYARTMGPNAPGIQFVTPQAQQALAYIHAQAVKYGGAARDGVPTMGAASPPPAAVQMLKANPGMKAAFDQKYGAGSAARFGIR